jgi:hypothetical protein
MRFPDSLRKSNAKTGKVKIHHRRIYELALNKVLSDAKDSISLEKLIEGIAQDIESTEREVSKELLGLWKEGKIILVDPKNDQSLLAYLCSWKSLWLWSALSATILSVLFSFVNSGFEIYFRYFFGTLLILVLPGYSIVQLIYFSSKTESRAGQSIKFDLTKITLSIGLSLGISPSVALLLNNSPFQITTTSVISSLAIMTIIFLFIAWIRQYDHYVMGSRSNSSALRNITYEEG